MNSEHKRPIGTGTSRNILAVDLVETGELPEYVCDVYRKANGLDPRLAKKLDRHWETIEVILFATMLAGIAVAMSTLFGKIHFSSATAKYATVTVSLAWSIVSFVIVGSKHALRSKFSGGFQLAMFWLLDLHPMTRDEFPTNETDLKFVYLLLLEDMAKLNMSLEREGTNRKDAAGLAHEELKMLYEGARMMGFIAKKDRKKGLKPAFEGARLSNTYKFLNAERWIADFDRRMAHDPTPSGVARRLYCGEVREN